MILIQSLSNNDMICRIEFCRWLQKILWEGSNFSKYVLLSNEATFHDTGQLNKHNCHYWLEEKPDGFSRLQISIGGA